MQTEITTPGPLLKADGSLAQVGWSRQPYLDCNLENVSFYALKFLQPFRVKRWDYYAVFTPQRFFSATVADLGYAGNIFVYTVDFATGEYYEEGLVIPMGTGIELPRNSTEGRTFFENKKARLEFIHQENERRLSVSWPDFQGGRGISAELTLQTPPDHEDMTIVIPIEQKRFYYNRKINCLPVSGSLRYGEIEESLTPDTCLASLDWGRGVWAYQSFWNWASASGFLPNGGTVGLNLGMGFGDTSAATENVVILNGKLHKLDQVSFDYDPEDYMKPWQFKDNLGRLSLEFVPFTERVAVTNLGVIFSEVHQMFGRYHGTVVTDQGETVEIADLIGFAEEHHARW